MPHILLEHLHNLLKNNRRSTLAKRYVYRRILANDFESFRQQLLIFNEDHPDPKWGALDGPLPTKQETEAWLEECGYGSRYEKWLNYCCDGWDWMKLLCRSGFHRWDVLPFSPYKSVYVELLDWHGKTTWFQEREGYAVTRICERCGKVEVGIPSGKGWIDVTRLMKD